MRRQHSAEIRHSFSIPSCKSPVVITEPKCPLTRGAARQLMRVKTAVRLEEGESPDVEPPFLPIPRLLLERGARARAVDRVHPAGSSSADVYTSADEEPAGCTRSTARARAPRSRSRRGIGRKGGSTSGDSPSSNRTAVFTLISCRAAPRVNGHFGSVMTTGLLQLGMEKLCLISALCWRRISFVLGS